MSSIEIARVEDLREGDRATLRLREDTTVTGPLVKNRYGLYVVVIGSEDSTFTHSVFAVAPNFVRATRELPELPTEPGSLVVLSTGERAVLDPNGEWFTANNWFGSKSVEPGYRTLGNIFQPEEER